jgi:hypothetical protein
MLVLESSRSLPSLFSRVSPLSPSSVHVSSLRLTAQPQLCFVAVRHQLVNITLLPNLPYIGLSHILPLDFDRDGDVDLIVTATSGYVVVMVNLICPPGTVSADPASGSAPCTPCGAGRCVSGAVSYRVVPCRTVSYRVVPCRTVSYRVVPCRTVSYRLVSSRLVSSRLASCSSGGDSGYRPLCSRPMWQRFMRPPFDACPQLRRVVRQHYLQPVPRGPLRHVARPYDKRVQCCVSGRYACVLHACWSRQRTCCGVSLTCLWRWCCAGSFCPGWSWGKGCAALRNRPSLCVCVNNVVHACVCASVSSGNCDAATLSRRVLLRCVIDRSYQLPAWQVCVPCSPVLVTVPRARLAVID